MVLLEGQFNKTKLFSNTSVIFKRPYCFLSSVPIVKIR